jgi:hypothetical protein
MKGKKGVYFFIMDVIIAVLIFTVTIVVLVSFNSSRPSIAGTQETLDIVVADLMNIEIRDISSSPHLQDLRLDGYPISVDNTVDQALLMLVNDSRLADAQLVVLEITSWLPPQYGLNYSVSGEQIYFRNAIRSVEDSQVRLSYKKLTILESNLTRSFSPAISEVVVWQ